MAKGIVFQKYFKKHLIKSKTLRWTLSLNFLIQPKAQELLHVKCDCSSHSISEDFSPESVTRAEAPRSLDATQEVLEKHYPRKVHEPLDVSFRSTRRYATTWLCRARGLSDPGP